MAAKKRKRFIWIIVFLLIAAGVGVVSVKTLSSKPTKIDPEKLAKVERIDLARSVVATGKIQPVTQVEIKSKASGIIQKLPVNVGDIVHKGQVICELDQNDLLPALKQQEAALHVAEANVKTAQADYERYKVDAEGPDVPFLKRDMERARKLFSDGLIAQNARDDSEKNYQMAAQKQESAQANLASAKAGIAKSQAALEQQQAALYLSRGKPPQCHHRVAHGRRRPLARQRSRHAVSSILVVGSGATLIMTIGDLSEVYVKGKADESDVGKVYLGQPARITVESFKDQKFEGSVTKISPMGVEKDNVTTFEVRVSISNEKHKLKAQMTANAEVMLDEHKAVLAIPRRRHRLQQGQVHRRADSRPHQREGLPQSGCNNRNQQRSQDRSLKGLTEGQQVILQ